MKKIILYLLLAMLFIVPAYALPGHIISNSADWRDVYSITLYANLIGVPSHFLVSTRHSTLVLYAIPKEIDELQVISSRSTPFVVGYQQIIEGKGYKKVTEEVLDDINLELARRLEDVNKYIVLDDSYGYNAISVGPFAASQRYYVLFADNRNIGRIESFLAGKKVEDIIIYGQVDPKVRDALAVYNPTIIDKGDRFDNNIEIVKMYQEKKHAGQAILTNGEFIEASLLSGTEPVVFIGRTSVPDQVKEYIKSSDIEVGVLIGNELISVATTIRRQIGISVFVKFAQGARAPQGSINPVEDLDRFRMPTYSFAIDIFSAAYNRATGALEVTWRNVVDLGVFMKSTITITDDTGDKIVGDVEPVFLNGNDYKTVVYTKTSDGKQLTLEGDNVTVKVSTIFGEGKRSLDNLIEKTFCPECPQQLEFVTIYDNSGVEFVDDSLRYDQKKSRFLVDLKNTGDVDAYVAVELIDLLVNGDYLTVGSEEIIKISKGAKGTAIIPVELTEADVAQNKEITAKAYYGERENSLVKVTEKVFPFKYKGIGLDVIYSTPVLIAVVIILILLILFARKKKCKHCGHRNAAYKRKCSKCNGKI